jgi:hypothetical protein
MGSAGYSRTDRRAAMSPAQQGADMIDRPELAYGSWPSPITIDSAVSSSLSLREVRLDGDDVYWTEGRPAEGGRQVIVRWNEAEGTSDVTPAPFNARTMAHEYGRRLVRGRERNGLLRQRVRWPHLSASARRLTRAAHRGRAVSPRRSRGGSHARPIAVRARGHVTADGCRQRRRSGQQRWSGARAAGPAHRHRPG